MRALTTSLALVLAAGCGAGATPVSTTTPVSLGVNADFGTVDANRDAHLTPAEFMTATAEYSAAFDTDRDGELSRDELAAGLFLAFDANGTGRIDEGELERGAMTWWPEDVAIRYRAWNTHPDGGLDEDELRAALERTAILSRWDADRDAKVTNAELSDALFASWDLDQSESIDPLEWRFD